MLAKDVRLARIKTAEMEEPQRQAVDLKSITGRQHLACGEVPIGNVVAVVPQDADTIEEPRNEVDVALVHEEPALGIHNAPGPQTILPPLEEHARRLCRRQGDEPEVVGSREKDRLLRRLQPIERQRIIQVRGQDAP